MAATDSGDLKYRAYIQRRRITPPDEDRSGENTGEASEIGGMSYLLKKSETFGRNSTVWPEEINDAPGEAEPIPPVEEYGKPFQNRKDRDQVPDAATSAGRLESSAYRKPYPRPAYRMPSYPSYRSFTGHRAQVEDNRATLLAIKVIKQALACFAILGIIVLMQGRPDMQGTLAFLRKHVVETHIDPLSIFQNVKEVFNQLVRSFDQTP